MRTSSIISYTAILATSTTYAFSFASPDSFDNSLLRGRSILPAVVSSDTLLVKRAEGQWDCADDEEYVPYGDDEGEDNEEEEVPVFQPNKGEVKAVTPPPQAVKQEEPKKAEQQQQQQPEATKPAAAPAPEATKPADGSKPVPAPAPISAPSSSFEVTPDNIAEGTYTAEEGCARFYTVKAGDVCLGLVEKNADLGLTLDQLYCLNPAIDDLCYNLWIGTSYCVGYNGEEPLNTGVSSKRA